MGALPSREASESPNTVYFTNNHGEVAFRLPLTPHYFPSSTCLAFQQLLAARNGQSRKYNFAVQDLDGLAPPAEVEAYRAAQREDWGPEVTEPDPSLHYYDAERRTRESAASATTLPRPSLEDAAALYHALVHAPTANGQLVDTNAEMCAAYAQEQRWARAQQVISDYEKKQQQELEDQQNGRALHRVATAGGEGGCGCEEPAAVTEARQVPPPKIFLAPLPEALMVQMNMEEVHKKVAQYRQTHGTTHNSNGSSAARGGGGGGGDGRQRLHNDKAEDELADAQPHSSSSTGTVAIAAKGAKGDSKRKKKIGKDPEALDEEMNDDLDEEKLLSYPFYNDEVLPFENDSKYMDGRVHLVEHEGVNYIFAYNPDYVRGLGMPVKVDASAIKPILCSEEFRMRRGWRRKTADTAEGESIEEGLPSTMFAPPGLEEFPHLFCWSEDSASHVPRDYFTTTYEVATRRPEDFDAHATGRGSATSATAVTSTSDPQQRRAYELLSSVYEKYYIPVLPVRVIGMDGMLRTEKDDVDAAVGEVVARRTRLVGGHDGTDDSKAAAAALRFLPHVPILKLCRFIAAAHGEKCLNRLTLFGVLVHLERCLLAGLPDALVRPLRSCYPLSDVPLLQFHREMTLRYSVATLEMGFHMHYIRDSLLDGERWNDFVRFVNSPMYGFRNVVPPEKVFRHLEIITSGTVMAAMENKMTVLKNIHKRSRDADDGDDGGALEDMPYEDFESCGSARSEESCCDTSSCCSNDGEGLSADSAHLSSSHCSLRDDNTAMARPAAAAAVGGGTAATTTASERSDTAASSSELPMPGKAAATAATTTTTEAMTPLFTPQIHSDGYLYDLARYCHHDFLLLREVSMLIRGIHTTVRGGTVLSEYTADACRNIAQALSRTAAPIISLPYMGRFPVAANLVFSGGIPAASVPISAAAESIRNVSLIVPAVKCSGSSSNVGDLATASAATTDVKTAIHLASSPSSSLVEGAILADRKPSSSSSLAHAAPAATVGKPPFLARPSRRFAYACLPPPSKKLQKEIVAQYSKGLIPCFVVTKQDDNYFLNPHQPNTTLGDILTARAAPSASMAAALSIQMEATYLWSHLLRMARPSPARMRQQREQQRLKKLAKKARKGTKYALAVGKANGKAAVAKMAKVKQFSATNAGGQEEGMDGEKGGEEDGAYAAAGAGRMPCSHSSNAAFLDDSFSSSISTLSTGASLASIANPNNRAHPLVNCLPSSTIVADSGVYCASALHDPIPTFDGDVVVMCPTSRRWIPLRTFQQLVRVLLAEKNGMSIDATEPIWRGVSRKAEKRYHAAVARARERAAIQQERKSATPASLFPTKLTHKGNDTAVTVDESEEQEGPRAAVPTKNRHGKEKEKEANRRANGDGNSNDNSNDSSSGNDSSEQDKDPEYNSIFDICGGGYCCCASGTHDKGGGAGLRKVGAGRHRESASDNEEPVGGDDDKPGEAGKGREGGWAVADNQLLPDINYNRLFERDFIKGILTRVKKRLIQERQRYGQDPLQLCRLECPVRFYGVYELLFAWTNSVMREERFENKEDPGWLREYSAHGNEPLGEADEGGEEEEGGATANPPAILQDAGFSMWSYKLGDGLGRSNGAIITPKACEDRPKGGAQAEATEGSRHETETRGKEELKSSGAEPDDVDDSDGDEECRNAWALTEPYLRPFTNARNANLRFFLGTKPTFQRRQAMRKRLNKRRRKENKAGGKGGNATPTTTNTTATSAAVVSSSGNDGDFADKAERAAHGAVRTNKAPTTVSAAAAAAVRATGSAPSMSHPSSYASPSSSSTSAGRQPTATAAVAAQGSHGSVGAPQQHSFFPPNMPTDTSGFVTRHNPYMQQQQQMFTTSVGGFPPPMAAVVADKSPVTASPGRTVVVVNVAQQQQQQQQGGGSGAVAGTASHLQSTSEDEDRGLPRAYRGSRRNQVPFLPPPPSPSSS